MTITAQIIPTLPALVEDGPGVDLDVANGTLTAQLDYRNLPDGGFLSDHPNALIAVQDPTTGEVTKVQAQQALAGKPIFIVSENQSNGEATSVGSYTYPPNLRVWNWNYTGTSLDTDIGTAFVVPQSNWMKYHWQAAARIAALNPLSPVYLCDFSKGGQALAQWLPDGYPTKQASNNTTIFNMLLIRQNNLPVAMAAAGVTEIDLHLMWQGEAGAAQTPELFYGEREYFHKLLRANSWFPYLTPMIQMSLSPYYNAGGLIKVNNWLKLWSFKEAQCRYFADTTNLPSTDWTDGGIHIYSQGVRRAGDAAAEAWFGRLKTTADGVRVITAATDLITGGSLNVTTLSATASGWSVNGNALNEAGLIGVILTAGSTLTRVKIKPPNGVFIDNSTAWGGATAKNAVTNVSVPCYLNSSDDTGWTFEFTASGGDAHYIAYNVSARVRAIPSVV